MKTINLSQLNDILIDSMVEKGRLTDPVVEAAFRKVKRHHFLQGIVEPEGAYDDIAIMLKSQVSSSSQPSVMAMMLECLELKPKQKVLEIGTASGYNAALLSELVKQDELVYTIEVEADLAERAARILREVGYPGITVIAGDGRKGYPVAASYDRIIVTAEAKSIYPALIEQLAQGGFFLAPFNIFDLLTVPIKLTPVEENRYRGPLVGFPVNFVPIRGVDIEEQSDQEVRTHYHKLTNHLHRAGLLLNQYQMVGLFLLMISWYQLGNLRTAKDYDDLINYWKSVDYSGIKDFDFEYDNAKKDWRLIPLF